MFSVKKHLRIKTVIFYSFLILIDLKQLLYNHLNYNHLNEPFPAARDFCNFYSC